ncbi:MAG: hypothetical protein M3Y64_01130, partial [Gemmatimonadota bacterium]|nr:hypothetical protein [Gemmatimonadota bacterium]
GATVSDSTNFHWNVGAMGNVVLTQVRPAVASRTLTELQFVQPVLMTDFSWRGIAFVSALNGEGYTLQRGELDAGIFGEGYVDRRHPHTLVHESMLMWRSEFFTRSTSPLHLNFSLAAGRGFVPFGSDDPMMRPLEKYPVNHHHSQIIERQQAVAAVQLTDGARYAAIEFARLNGDEPAGPFKGPRWSRFGDSWAARFTVQPLDGLELSASRALVHSPELQQGGAFDHAQHNALARFDKPNSAGNTRYVLAEWARTDELTNQRTAFQYYSALAEAAYGWHWARLAARYEQTDRSEQQRLRDPFREPVGHVEFQILGVTQWKVATVALEGPSTGNRLVRGAPFVEVARAQAASRNSPSVFEPALFYGKPTLWLFTIGIRLRTGTMRGRMGRYGVMENKTNSMSTMMPGMQ